MCSLWSWFFTLVGPSKTSSVPPPRAGPSDNSAVGASCVDGDGAWAAPCCKETAECYCRFSEAAVSPSPSPSSFSSSFSSLSSPSSSSASAVAFPVRVGDRLRRAVAPVPPPSVGSGSAQSELPACCSDCPVEYVGCDDCKANERVPILPSPGAHLRAAAPQPQTPQTSGHAVTVVNVRTNSGSLELGETGFYVIVGCGCGLVLFLAALIALCVCFCARRRRSGGKQKPPPPPKPPTTRGPNSIPPKDLARPPASSPYSGAIGPHSNVTMHFHQYCTHSQHPLFPHLHQPPFPTPSAPPASSINKTCAPYAAPWLFS
eukprot:GHVT01027318.1.p1 GENE.GHVT01027318.1~~GHVT01027318.1.p1  ORF type:complete len:317 (+),score=58.18 GHVT01027318.1:127-1077(+)